MHVSSARAGIAPDSRAASAAPTMSEKETRRAMAMPSPGLSRSERPPAPPEGSGARTYQQTLATVEGYLDSTTRACVARKTKHGRKHPTRRICACRATACIVPRESCSSFPSWPPSRAGDASSDLAAFENNDLDDPTGALYYDEGTTALTLSQVNALPGAAGNISADPLLDSTGHLAPESPCRNAGTASGAPATDIDGQPRPQEGAFDIGADEFVP